MRAEAFEDGGVTFRLEQRFTYSYESPVRRLRHRLIVVPRAVHGSQVRLGHGITATGDAVVVATTSDGFDNHVVELRAPAVRERIEFETWSVVAFRPSQDGITPLPASAGRDAILTAPTRLTAADGALADAARDLAEGGHRGLALAERACAWAHSSLVYEYGITGVRTTAAQAVAGGRGVCQDYAHVMLALCRAAGLPCRYVSGHLVGEGGSHAWVEVIVGAVAVAFDPTHDRRARSGYLTIAVGRDYADVAPTSGTFEGSCGGALHAQKRLRLVQSD